MSGADSLIIADLVCPSCHGSLRRDPGPDRGDPILLCESCGLDYPIVRGVPVPLLADSAFDADSLARGADAYFPDQGVEDRRKARIRRSFPALASDLDLEATDELVRGLVARTARTSPTAGPTRGLVVGAGRRADDYRAWFPGVDLLITDVEPALGSGVVADVLALPVADGSQDLVVAEHVIEHVVDPVRAGREIERVLRPGGVVLAKVPFSYPWHGGHVDFFRFTPAGSLAAFTGTEPVHIGHGPGPMSSVAYTLQSVWVSLFRRPRWRMVAVAVGRVGLGWLKHLDRFVIGRPGSLDLATSLVLVGRRSDRRRSPQETVVAARRLGGAPVLPPPVADRC